MISVNQEEEEIQRLIEKNWDGFFFLGKTLIIPLGRRNIKRCIDEGTIPIIQRSIVCVYCQLQTKVLDIIITMCFESG